MAAIAFPAAPALAEESSSSSAPFAAFGSAPAFSGNSQGGIPVKIHRGTGIWHDNGGNGDHRRRNRRDRGDTIIVGDGFGYYGGEWARWNNRTFESDSYNDWWHDQPWRSYPRWTTQNLGCDKRWYSGDILRC
jgi:hypothetical protein